MIAHSPLGGPGRKRALARQRALADVASALGATPAEVALAWLLDLAPAVGFAIPGARTPEAARSAGSLGGAGPTATWTTPRSPPSAEPLHVGRALVAQPEPRWCS